MIEMTPVPKANRPISLLAFLSFAAIVSFVALLLSIQNAYELTNQERLDERQQTLHAIEMCEWGNDLRDQVTFLGESTGVFVTGILDTVFSSVRDPGAVEALRERLAPVIAEYQQVLTEIEKFDCDRLRQET